ncbi:MAG TPA: 4-hydroxy-tetrahydrodipicolinate reductase, partial [Xanthomonadaceae bacterium]|nr:4-hydroxy-tetrahydrodipicolinate reductase [Xanthomonadaceae bacterium]
MPTRLLIHGASGRMGQALLRLAADDPGLAVVGAVSRKPTQRVIDGV